MGGLERARARRLAEGMWWCVCVCVGVCVCCPHSKAHEQARLSDSRVADEYEYEEVVVVGPHARRHVVSSRLTMRERERTQVFVLQRSGLGWIGFDFGFLVWGGARPTYIT